MSDVKRCVQCGMLKEAEAFRKYTYSRQNSTEGRYRVCKSCEAINAAYRRAKALLEDYCDGNSVTVPGHMFFAVTKARDIVDKTEKLYATLEGRGLRVPTVATKKDEASAAIDSLLKFYEASTPQATVQVSPQEMPDELRHWLEVDMAEWKENNISPEYLQETIYESLKAKYRPQTGVNKDTFVPIYDDTYKTVLNDILRRFDDYEEECSLDGQT